MKIKILLVDDHAVLREGMRRLLENDKDFKVVGEASDGEEAVEIVSKLKPDVVLMDIVMPKLNGVEATKQIRQLSPETHVLILTAYNDTAYILGLLEAGACGYLLKHARGSEIKGAIRAVQSGESVLDPVVTRKLIERVIGASKRTGEYDSKEQLSQREAEVLRLAANGMSTQDIARVLFVSVRTVKAHFTNVFNKMGVRCRTDAIVKGIKEGYIVVDDMLQG
jgi:NarL family two-component system response regulator LiaR